MTEKELFTIYYALHNAKNCIENLANDNYPYEEFKSEAMREMFYQVNSMCIEVSAMIEAKRNKEERSDDE